MIQKIGLAITTSLLSWNISFAQTIDSYIPSQKNIEARKEFQDNKFGIFIHWGIYSMLAQGEWYMTNHNIDWREYEKLASGFYPSRFNAAEWVSAIKASGQNTFVLPADTMMDFLCFTPNSPTLIS